MRPLSFRKFRIVFASLLIVSVMVVFLDIRQVIPERWTNAILYTQFVPSLLKFINLPVLLASGFIVVLALTLFTGRSYCSFLCPLGIFQDIITRVAGFFNRRNRRFRFTLPHTILRYSILALTVIVVLVGSTLMVTLLDPYSIFGRMMTYFLKPAVVQGNNLIASVFIKFDIYRVYTIQLKGITAAAYILPLLFLGLIGYMAYRHGRLYCNTICPVGTFLGLISKASIFGIRIDNSRCTRCGRCAMVCKSSCIDFLHESVDVTRCVACFNCIDSCNDNAILFGIRRSGPAFEGLDSEKMMSEGEVKGKAKGKGKAKEEAEEEAKGKAKGKEEAEEEAKGKAKAKAKAKEEAKDYTSGSLVEERGLAIKGNTSEEGKIIELEKVNKSGQTSESEAKGKENTGKTSESEAKGKENTGKTSEAEAKDRAGEVDLSKRNFLFNTLALSTAFAGIANGQDAPVPTKNSTVRETKEYPVCPPGGIGQAHFNDYCTACSLCVSACPTSVLRPSFRAYGLAGIMQPVMDYHKGFCNFECTVCIDICPTGALMPLVLEAKKLTQLGKAHFIKENCIVETERTDCGACSEHCPTKAVKMVPFIGNLVIPEVQDDICIGCGACEYACPTTPFKAIYVNGNPVHLDAKKPETGEAEHKVLEEFPF